MSFRLEFEIIIIAWEMAYDEVRVFAQLLLGDRVCCRAGPWRRRYCMQLGLNLCGIGPTGSKHCNVSYGHR